VPRLPALKPREVISIITALGFVEVRQRGSHKQFAHPDGRRTTVPVHRGRDVSPALLRLIIRDLKVSADEFMAQRRGRGERD
jgi:predicted RNA binding protein YcfA (HicA-like mRNA interferase family)